MRSVGRLSIKFPYREYVRFHLIFDSVEHHPVPAITDSKSLLHHNRRKYVPLLLSELQSEEIMNIMHALHYHLLNSPPIQRPLVATLLLNIDLLVSLLNLVVHSYYCFFW